MDRILIARLPLRCHLGVTAEERAAPQSIVVDVELSLDLTAAAQSDSIADTINYSLVCDRLEAVAMVRHYKLIESLCHDITADLFREFRAVQQIRVLVRKPAALARRGAAYAAVALVRTRG